MNISERGKDTEGGDKRAQVRTNMSRFNVVRYGPDLLTCYASAKCKRRELRCTPAVVNVLTGVSLVHVAVIYSVSSYQSSMSVATPGFKPSKHNRKWETERITGRSREKSHKAGEISGSAMEQMKD